MKILIMIALALFTLTNANALPQNLVCLTATFNADGGIALVTTMYGPQIILLNSQTKAISLYTLKDPWSLYNTHYNRNAVFDMSLVQAYKSISTFEVSADAVAAKWVLSQEGTLQIKGEVKANSTTLTGHVSTENWDNGTYTGGTEADLQCTNAGIR